jgi:hypothetical protein
MSAFYLCNKPPTAISCNCVYKPRCACVRACVRTSDVQLDLTGPTPCCYVPRLRVSSHLNMFFSLDLRNEAVPHGDAPWPTRISSFCRYARRPPPVAAPYPIYRCRVLTGAQFVPVVVLRAGWRTVEGSATEGKSGLSVALGVFP